jgi:potassium-transporting ATPase KdpC subunit
MKYISRSIILLTVAVLICCVLYPLGLWAIGQAFFPFQANGSILRGPDGNPVGSRLIAQPFTKDQYFQPRPSAASYDASASASSSLAASNPALRDRVARALGPIVKYRSGPKAGKPVAPDIESWFQQNAYKGKPHLVAQWAEGYNSLAQAWAKADPAQADYIETWAKMNPDLVKTFTKDNPAIPEPKAADLAVMFFKDFSLKHPGKFPALVTRTSPGGKPEKIIEWVNHGPEIQSIFFDMWWQEHPEADIQDIPADMVTTSGSGLDPHITLQNALIQLDRVASKWAAIMKRAPNEVSNEIETLLREKADAPWDGIAGEKYVNVLEINLELRKRYRAPGSE